MTSNSASKAIQHPGVGPNDPSGERRSFLQRVRAAAHDVIEPVERAAELDAQDINGDLGAGVAVFSIGNAREAHGPCLPLDIDDRTSAHVAVAVANHTGARYLGPVPYCTDGVGDLARTWSSAYLPVSTFYERTREFVSRQLQAHYDEQGQRRPRLIFFISGHGGNGAMKSKLERLAFDCGVLSAGYGLSIVDEHAQHAGDVEHAVASQLGPGCFDAGAYADCNARLGMGDTECFELLQRYPTLAGMAGFYLFGGTAFDAIRGRYAGVKSAVRDVLARRTILASPEVGSRVLQRTIAQNCRDLLARAAEVGCVLPVRLTSALGGTQPMRPDMQAVQFTLVDQGGNILLQHRDDDALVLPSHWGFFGGAFEQGETPEQALAREAWEELQLDLPEMTYLGRIPHLKGAQCVCSHLYVGRLSKSEAPLEPRQREGQGLGFFSWRNLQSLLIANHDWLSHARLRRHLEASVS